MKVLLWISTICALAFALSSCGNSGGKSSPGHQTGTGPFDGNGNYVEEWADSPSKWRKGGSLRSPGIRKSAELPEIVKNDQPPQNAVPIQTISTRQIDAAPTTAQAVVVRPETIARKTEPVIVKKKRVVERPERVVIKSKSKSKLAAKTKTKTKQIVKTKAKPKSTSSRYTVKKGDSISTVASRTGSSVSAIKKANGISGSTIRPGQSLRIPK